MTVDAQSIDVAKLHADAELWLRVFDDASSSEVLPWLNGRCHPSVVLALCERIRELETKP